MSRSRSYCISECLSLRVAMSQSYCMMQILISECAERLITKRVTKPASQLYTSKFKIKYRYRSRRTKNKLDIKKQKAVRLHSDCLGVFVGQDPRQCFLDPANKKQRLCKCTRTNSNIHKQTHIPTYKHRYKLKIIHISVIYHPWPSWNSPRDRNTKIKNCAQ